MRVDISAQIKDAPVQRLALAIVTSAELHTLDAHNLAISRVKRVNGKPNEYSVFQARTFQRVRQNGCSPIFGPIR